MKSKTYNHTIIQEAHPLSLTNIDKIVSEAQEIDIKMKPTKRHMKKLELEYLYCPDCESQEIYRNGKSNVGTQRFRCKECNYQFVVQYDALFPQSMRREIFEEEFLSNLKPTGFDKVGTGRKKYWHGERLGTLQMLESQVFKIQANKIIKANPVRGDKEYSVLLEILVHESYNRVMCE